MPAKAAAIGHNSGDVIMGEARDKLKAYLERAERLDDERRELGDAFSEVMKEAKGDGFNPKILRRIVTLRRQDEGKRKEEQAILDLYAHALGLDLV